MVLKRIKKSGIRKLRLPRSAMMSQGRFTKRLAYKNPVDELIPILQFISGNFGSIEQPLVIYDASGADTKTITAYDNETEKVTIDGSPVSIDTDWTLQESQGFTQTTVEDQPDYVLPYVSLEERNQYPTFDTWTAGIPDGYRVNGITSSNLQQVPNGVRLIQSSQSGYFALDDEPFLEAGHYIFRATVEDFISGQVYLRLFDRTNGKELSFSGDNTGEANGVYELSFYTSGALIEPYSYVPNADYVFSEWSIKRSDVFYPPWPPIASYDTPGQKLWASEGVTSDAFTIIARFKMPEDNGDLQTVYVQDVSTDLQTHGRLSLYVDTNTNRVYIRTSDGTDTTDAYIDNVTLPGNWVTVVCRGSESHGLSVSALNNEVYAVEAFVFDPGAADAVTIGSYQSVSVDTYQFISDISHVQLYDFVLTDAQIDFVIKSIEEPLALGVFPYPTDVPFDDVWELSQLYRATDGDNWTNNTDWMTGTVIDNWYGITVNSNKVGVLAINNNSLNGDITEWDLPTKTTSINLNDNPDLDGVWTDKIFPPSLLDLYINNTGISSAVDSWTSASLENLDIGDTTTSLNVETVSLPSIETLKSSGTTTITGDIVSFPYWDSIIDLTLSDSDISCNTTFDLSSSPQLVSVNLSDNAFTQTEVHNIIDSFYTNRDNLTSMATLNIGGSNAAPDGTREGYLTTLAAAPYSWIITYTAP